MAKKVVKPAMISTFMDDPAAVTPKNLSRPLTFFCCVTGNSSNTFLPLYRGEKNKKSILQFL